MHSSDDDDDDDDDDSVCSAFIVGARILLGAGLVPSGRTKPLVAVAATCSDSAQRQHACDFMALSWNRLEAMQ